MEQLVDELLVLSMQQHLLNAFDVELKKTTPPPRMSEAVGCLADLQESILANETCVQQICDRLNTETALNEPPIDQRKIATATRLLKAKTECATNDKALEPHLKQHGVTLEQLVEMSENEGDAISLGLQCEQLKALRDSAELIIAERAEAAVRTERWTKQLQQNSAPVNRSKKWASVIAGLRNIKEVGEEIEDNIDDGTIVVPLISQNGIHRLFVHLLFEERNGCFGVKDVRITSPDGSVCPQLALFASEEATRTTDLSALIRSVYSEWSREFLLIEEIDALRITNGIDWIPAKRTLLLMVSGGKRTISLTVDTNYPAPGSLHLNHITAFDGVIADQTPIGKCTLTSWLAQLQKRFPPSH